MMTEARPSARLLSRPSTSVYALGLVLFATIATAEPVHRLGPPTPAAIKAVLEKGVSIEAGQVSVLVSRGLRVTASGFYGAAATGRAVVKGNRVFVSGSGSMACMGDESSCGPESLSWSFDQQFTVLGATETTLLLQLDRDSTTSEPSRGPFLVGASASWTGTAVQLVAGAKDPKVALAAEKLIDGWQDTGMLFVRGPPATNPRTVTEIFFAKDQRPNAEDLAQKLAPVIGTVVVKPWPGEQPFQVVVVFGDTKR